MKDSIENLTSEILLFMAANHLVEYPRALESDSESILQVEWESDDWRTFLLLASVVGTNVVYVGISKFAFDSDEVTINEMEGGGLEAREGPSLRDLRFSEDDDDAVFRLFGRKHEGEAISLSLAYAASGVVHSWTMFAPWYEEALSTLEELRERRELVGETILSGARELRDRAVREGWALTVARDRRFFTAQAIPSVRQQITLAILTEITGINSSDPLLVGVSWSTSSSAKSLLPQVKRELEDESIARVPQLTSELIRIHPEWATLRVALREKYARAFLIETIGMNLPIVTEEIARYSE